jgi:hypothetical protein
MKKEPRLFRNRNNGGPSHQCKQVLWCAHPSAEALYKKTANTKAANVKLAVFRCGGGETQLSYRLEKRDDSLEKKEVRAEWPMEDVSCDCSGVDVGP